MPEASSARSSATASHPASAEAFLLALADRLHGHVDPDRILAETAEALGRHLGVSRVGYGEVDAAGRGFDIARDWTDGVKSVVGRHSLPEGSPIVARYRTGKTLVCADAHSIEGMTAEEQAVLDAMQIRSFVSVPLIRNRRFAALMSAQHHSPREWSGDEVALIEQVAQRIWSALEHARTASRLRESEARFRTLAENMPSICWIGDENGMPTWFNRKGHEFFQGNGAELGDLMAVCDPAELVDVTDAWTRAIATGEPLEKVVSLRGGTGDFTPFLSRAEPIRDAHGRVISWCGVITDLSEQTAAERRKDLLSSLRERLRGETNAELILETTAELLGRHLGASWVCYGEFDSDLEGCFTIARDWNDGTVPSAVGRKTYRSMDTPLFDAYRSGTTIVADDVASHPLLNDEVGAYCKKLGIAAAIDVPLVKQGRLAALLSVHQSVPRHWTPDEVRLVEEVAERIWSTLTRARAETRLRAREADQAFLLAWSDSIRDAVDPRSMLATTLAALGRHLRVSRVNYAEADPSGETLLVADDWTDGLHSVAGAQFPLAALGPAVLEGHLNGAHFQTSDVHSDARFDADNIGVYDAVGAAAFVSVPLVKSGRLIAVLSVQQSTPRAWTADEVRLLEDVADRTWAIIERARSEERSRESEALLAAFLENSPIAMYLKDADGRYLRINPEMAVVIGVPAEQAVGKTAFDFMTREVAERVTELDQRALAGGVEASEISLPGRDRYSSLLSIRFPFTPHDGAAPRLGGFTLDLTDRKRAEAALERSRESLFQSEKLTALGSLLAGVSHELNNPLSIVVAQAVMMERQSEGSPLAERAQKIRKAADRCARIVQTFLAMARQKQPEREQVDLNAVVAAACDLTDYGLRTDGVAVSRELAADLPPIFADADQLHQVIINLIINAQQAMAGQESARRITLATRPGEDGGSVVLEVTDSGPGIPADVGRRIFEPFFTTKPQGLGTGVGLSFSQGLVEAHGGSLELVESEQGARFRVTLPLGESVGATDGGMAGAGQAEPKPRTALVIDDEPEIGESLADFLALEGYRCVAVTSGKEAQAQLAQGNFDLVVSDLRMPEMDGEELFDWIKAKRPDIAARTAFATGDTLGAAVASFIAREGRPVLEKPFTPESVVRLLQQMELA